MIIYKPQDVEILEKELEANWPNIRKAREFTLKGKKVLEEILNIVLSSLHVVIPYDEINVIVFGSLARKEFTSGSDIDWTLLVDGKANPQHLNIAQAFKKELENKEIEGLKVKGPTAGGTFGGLAFSHDIIHNIGGNDDTNKNTTQRILLLLESSPIGPCHGDNNAHERVIQGVLNRYIIEDRPATTGEKKVPRFLLNDIVRYWRTMAVDFGHKRRQREWKGSALRTVKLRMSRKLIYVSGMLACFACAMDESLNHEDSSNIVDYLSQILKQSPLDIISSIVLSHDRHEQLYLSIKAVMDNYDNFLQIIDDEQKRRCLDGLLPDELNSNPIYQESKLICEGFERGLEGIFFEENGTELFSLVKKYGVF